MRKGMRKYRLKMKITKNKWNLIFLIFGLILFFVFLYKFGLSAISIIKYNINYYYLLAFVTTSFLSFVPHTLRFKSILDSYGKNIGLKTLMRHNISAFSLSYITPASRLGGEPIRVYMMNKEQNIDYKTGTSVVLLDKFVEILGSLLYGIIGLVLLIYMAEVPIIFRWIFGFFVFVGLLLIYIFYFRTKNNKQTISKLFYFLRLNKLKKLTNIGEKIKEIEMLMGDFFRNKKKALFKSFIFYLISGIFFIVMFKFLLLSIGFNATIAQVVLAINIWGLMNFAPSPSSLGFLEAGQSGLFHVISGDGSNGLVVALLLRVAFILLTCLGFFFISKFGYNRIKKDALK